MTEDPVLNQPIKSLQLMLKTIAYALGTIPIVNPDGIFDATTQQAVRAFQQEYDLPVTGIADETTFNKIVEVYRIAQELIVLAQSPVIHYPVSLNISPEQSHPHIYLAQAMFTAIHNEFPEFRELDLEIKKNFLTAARASVAAQSRRTDDFLRTYAFLAERNIHPVVVKGLACRMLWNEPDFRPSGDEDILLSPDQVESCRGALAEYGYASLSDDSEEEEFTYLSPLSGLRIELHRRLFSESSEYFSQFNQYFEKIFDTAIPLSSYGREILTPEPTLNMLYLILHAFKHFIHSGVGIRQLCDISLFANRYGSQIVWNKVREVLQKIGAGCWYASVLTICRDRLTLHPEQASLPDEHFADAADTGALLEDILSGAIYGASDMARHHSGNVTLHAVEKGGKSGTLLRTLFPSAKVLKPRYKYLKKHPYLLPVAWVSRLVGYKKKSADSGLALTESLEIGRSRVELLKKYGII